ncbi:MAG TPA: ABC transporter substrate-binding protein [Stellaceae bacterium]|jgi:NitT/TauT family transport system substrate-binding protein|nr:ABC transporter substrate-binding protein [Stellaceae bacterium]
MRKILSLIAACMCLGATAPAWAGGMKLAIGYVPNGDFVPVFMAQEKGYFAKAGLDATLTPIPIPSNVPAALTSASIDVGPATAVNLFQTAENGLNLVAISGYNRNLADKEPAQLILKTGAPYKGPSDIVGKRIGTPGLLSTFDLFLKSWLRKNGIDRNAVTQVDMTFPPMSDMLKSGQVDAVIAVDPFRSQIVKNGVGFIAANFMADVSKDCVGLVWLANKDWAAAHPKERAAFIAGLKLGIADAVKDAAAAEEVEKKYLKFAAPITDDFNLTLTTADLQFFQEMMEKEDFLHKKINVADLMVQ